MIFIRRTDPGDTACLKDSVVILVQAIVRPVSRGQSRRNVQICLITIFLVVCLGITALRNLLDLPTFALKHAKEFVGEGRLVVSAVVQPRLVDLVQQLFARRRMAGFCGQVSCLIDAFVEGLPGRRVVHGKAIEVKDFSDGSDLFGKELVDLEVSNGFCGVLKLANTPSSCCSLWRFSDVNGRPEDSDEGVVCAERLP